MEVILHTTRLVQFDFHPEDRPGYHQVSNIAQKKGDHPTSLICLIQSVLHHLYQLLENLTFLNTGLAEHLPLGIVGLFHGMSSVPCHTREQTPQVVSLLVEFHTEVVADGADDDGA